MCQSTSKHDYCNSQKCFYSDLFTLVHWRGAGEAGEGQCRGLPGVIFGIIDVIIVAIFVVIDIFVIIVVAIFVIIVIIFTIVIVTMMATILIIVIIVIFLVIIIIPDPFLPG